MLWDYIEKDLCVAVSKTMLEVGMMEFCVATLSCVALFLVWFFRLNDKIFSSGKIAVIKKFLWEDKWRIISITLFLLAWHIFILSPYLLYQQNKITIDDLTAKSETNLETISFLQEEVDNHIDIKKCSSWDCNGYGRGDFFAGGDWANSLIYFKAAFADFEIEKATPHHLMEVWDDPLYLFDQFMIKISQKNISHQDYNLACFALEEGLAKMTNNINEAIDQKSESDAYNSVGCLTENITQLKKIRKIVPDCETNFTDQIIQAVIGMTNNPNIFP